MIKPFISAWLATLIAVPAFAAQSDTTALAIDSYRHVVNHEDRLVAAIKSGSRVEFDRFITRPTMDILKRWPPLADQKTPQYARCFFALDGFRLYADEQFAAGGRLPKDKGQAKDYFEQKAACKTALRGKI